MALEPAATGLATLEASLEEKRVLVEAGLRRLQGTSESPAVSAALEHSLYAPAKRLRPILALLVAEVLEGDAAAVLPAACAIEMAHTASLILDDLPCMDDATLRRGQPACHVQHGEASAILAAFALLNRAYELLAEGWPGAPDAEGRAALSRELARAVGLSGMIAGQASDLALTNANTSLRALEFIHSRKSGALFMASAMAGATGRRANKADREAIAVYAKNLGLAFQIVDDLIDVTARADEAGKDVGQDRQKTTFVSFSGAAGARQLAEELIAASREALAGFGPRADPLRDLARYALSRKN